MILIIITFIILLWYFLNLIFFYFKTDYVLGQDNQMVLDQKDEYRNYPIVYFDFEKEVDNIYETIINKCKKQINDYTHPLRMTINKNQTKYQKIEDTSDKIVSYTFCKIKSRNELSEKEIIKQTINNPNKVKFFIYDTGYLVCFSHLFYDGMNAFKVSQSYCDNYDEIKLPFFTYIPIYFDYLLLKSGIKYLLNPINKHLNYNSTLSKNVHFKMDLLQFKKLKNNLECNFSFLLIAFQLYLIFNSSKEDFDTLTIGIVMAFSNKTRRNNFTALPIKIVKPKLKNNNLLDYVKNILNQLEKKSKDNYHYIQSIYTFTNIYDFNFAVNSCIDLLVSGFPMCKKNDFCINNVKLVNTETIFRHTSMPLYIYHMSTLDDIFLSYNIKTKQIDEQKIVDNSVKVNNFLKDIDYNKEKKKLKSI